MEEEELWSAFMPNLFGSVKANQVRAVREKAVIQTLLWTKNNQTEASGTVGGKMTRLTLASPTKLCGKLLEPTR